MGCQCNVSLNDVDPEALDEFRYLGVKSGRMVVNKLRLRIVLLGGKTGGSVKALESG